MKGTLWQSGMEASDQAIIMILISMTNFWIVRLLPPDLVLKSNTLSKAVLVISPTLCCSYVLIMCSSPWSASRTRTLAGSGPSFSCISQSS